MLKEWREQDMNMKKQFYKGLPLSLMYDAKYGERKAKRYSINDTDQTIWIPNAYLEDDGTIKENIDILWIFKPTDIQEKVSKAGYRYTYK